MSRGKELIKSTGILMIAKISTQIVNFLLIPFYTALLTTQEYGEIDIYTSLIMIVIPFITLQLEMGLFRYFIEEKTEKGRARLVKTTSTIVMTSVLVVSVIYFFIVLFVPIKYKFLIYLYYIFSAISSVLLQLCRAEGNNVAYGFSSFLISSLTVFLNVFFIYGLGMKVKGVLISTILANIISCIYMIYVTGIIKYLKNGYYSVHYAKKLLNYSVPLIFNQISSWVINYSDRIIILTMWGTASNGIYSLANKFSNITNTFFGVYNLAWSENVIRSLGDNDSVNYINKVFNLTFKLYLLLVTGIVNVLPFCFAVLVNKDYVSAYGHIPLLLIAMFFSGMAATIGSIYIGYGKTKEVSITTIMAGVCNILIHLVLLDKCKLYAASISTFISFALLFIYRYIFVKHFFELKFNVLICLPEIIICVASWIAYCSKDYILISICFIINILYCILLFYKNKKILINLLKHKKN